MSEKETRATKTNKAPISDVKSIRTSHTNSSSSAGRMEVNTHTSRILAELVVSFECRCSLLFSMDLHNSML